MAKRRNIRELRETQFLRAAMIHVEKTLRYDPTRSYSISQIADMAMIRKQWIRKACIESPHVKAIPYKGKTHFQYSGPLTYVNPAARGIDPLKLLPGKTPRAKRSKS